MGDYDQHATELQQKMHTFRVMFKKWTDQQHSDLDTMDREYTTITTNGKATIDDLQNTIDDHQATVEKHRIQAQQESIQLDMLQKQLHAVKQDARALPQLSDTLRAQIQELEAALAQQQLEKDDELRQEQARLALARARVDRFESALGLRVRVERGMLHCALSQAHPSHPLATLTFVMHLDAARRCRVFQLEPPLPALTAPAEELARTGDMALFVHRARRAFRDHLHSAR